MSGNSFGQLFRITTFGESHGKYTGVVIDGCPAGLEIDHSFIAAEMEKRRPGKSEVSSGRSESDRVEIVSGIVNNVTTGSPVAMLIANEDARPEDYAAMKTTFRPSHADFTYYAKYGTRDHKGGGRSSARETAARVAAGAIAKLVLKNYNISILAYSNQIGNIVVPDDYSGYTDELIHCSDIRCPDQALGEKMKSAIQQARAAGESLGGVVKCVVKGCPAGLGEPVFNKLEADLAKAMLSIPGSKGFDVGEGFASATMKGSEHNDIFASLVGKVITTTNHSGGIQGGISNGMDIIFRVAFKPTASIPANQQTVDIDGNEARISSPAGRHDPCVVPRACAVVEAMAALVLADHLLLNRTVRLNGK